MFIWENRQSFLSKVHVKVYVQVSSVNCYPKDVDSSDCDLCTLANSELFELWTWVCMTSHLYPVTFTTVAEFCARLRLWPSFPVALTVSNCFWQELLGFFPASISRFLTVDESTLTPAVAKFLWRSLLVFLRSLKLFCNIIWSFGLNYFSLFKLKKVDIRRFETKLHKILENVVPYKIDLNLYLMVCWSTCSAYKT